MPGGPWSSSSARDFAASILCGHEVRDPRDGPEAIELEIIVRHLNAELLLELRQEFHKHERVQIARVDQVHLRRRDLKVELLSYQRGDLTGERVGARHSS